MSAFPAPMQHSARPRREAVLPAASTPSHERRAMNDAPASRPDVLTIDIVSDVVCPWCYIGKRRLESALAARAQPATLTRWHPFQLNPDIPAEGVDRRRYLEDKFGGPERAR